MTVVHQTAEMLAHKLGLEHPDTIRAFQLCEDIANAERELDTLALKWQAEEADLEDDEPLYYTWYLDIEYWNNTNLNPNKCVNNWLFKCELKGSETVKILKGAGEKITLNVNFNETTRKATLEAKMQNSAGQGTGIIEYLGYFLTDANLSKEEALAAFDNPLQNGVQSFTQYSNYMNKTANNLNNTDNKYLVVLAKSVNGEYSIVIKDISQPADDPLVDDKGTEPNKPTNNSNDDEESAGLFSDFEIGELILIVLVIVLIVSCALIITQKIVDYKKRLY